MTKEPPSPAPSCPDCGGTKVEPIAYGAEEREQSGPYPTRGGIAHSSDSPHWACTACAAQFGKKGQGNAVRTLAEWQALLPTLLPKPVEVQPNGEFWGGEGPDVMITVDDRGIQVKATKIDWVETHRPTVNSETIETFPLDTPAVKVAKIITRVWAKQLGKYQWCPRCNERFRSEHMHDDAICHGCAERYLGCIH